MPCAWCWRIPDQSFSIIIFSIIIVIIPERIFKRLIYLMRLVIWSLPCRCERRRSRSERWWRRTWDDGTVSFYCFLFVVRHLGDKLDSESVYRETFYLLFHSFGHPWCLKGLSILGVVREGVFAVAALYKSLSASLCPWWVRWVGEQVRCRWSMLPLPAWECHGKKWFLLETPVLLYDYWSLSGRNNVTNLSISSLDLSSWFWNEKLQFCFISSATTKSSCRNR